MPSRITKNSEPRLHCSITFSPARRLSHRRLRGDPRGLIRLEPGEEWERAQRGHVGLGQARPGADDRRMALALRLARLGLGGLEEGEHLLDVALGALVIQDAQAQREAAVQPRGRDQAGAASLQRGRDPGVALVVEIVSAEADDAERGRRHQLERLARLDAPGRRGGDVERAADRLAEGVEPEVAQRDPELQRSRRARQLQAEVGEVDLAVGRARVVQVVRVHLERVAAAPGRRGRARSRTRTAGRATCAGRA